MIKILGILIAIVGGLILCLILIKLLFGIVVTLIGLGWFVIKVAAAVFLIFLGLKMIRRSST